VKIIRLSVFILLRLLAFSLSVLGMLAWLFAFGAIAFTSPAVALAAICVGVSHRK
jgi:hypothetical protein